jgi:hypothetical protein
MFSQLTWCDETLKQNISISKSANPMAVSIGKLGDKQAV